MATELEIGPGLVGRRVSLPARPEWGIGTVMRVQSTTVAGQPRHRVSVQFAVGHRTLTVPPARLTEPAPEPQRQPSWLETVGGQALDDALSRLPGHVAEFLGTPAQRMAMLAQFYTYTEDPASLSKWARAQTGAADPLALWSRDELLVAFRRFCDERDAEFRVAAAKLKQAADQAALDEVLAAQPEPLRSAMRAALQRPL